MSIFDMDCKGCAERRRKMNEYMEGVRDRLLNRKPDPKTLPPIKTFGAVPQKVDKEPE